jgi:hypothetical protein
MDKLRGEHGSVLTVGNRHAVAVFRSADEAEWLRFNSDVVSEREKPSAQRRLVVACCVWPSKEEFVAILAKRPGFANACAGPVAEHSGCEEVTVKKD